MKIGKHLNRNAKYKLTYFFYSLLGTLDLHSHLRLKPVLNYLRDLIDSKNKLNILEIGCGGGVIPFQLL